MTREGKRCGTGTTGQNRTCVSSKERSTCLSAQLTFAYVPARVLDGGVPVDVGQQTQAEAVLVVGGVGEAVH